MSEAVSINLTEYRRDEVELRQIAPGMLPLILIEPEHDEGDGLSLNVDISLIGADGAVAVLQIVLDALRENGYGGDEEDPTD